MILPGAFAADPDRLAGFYREARVPAPLNHRTSRDDLRLEGSGATHALVLELVECDTLADQVERGPLAVGEALPIARHRRSFRSVARARVYSQ